MNKLVLVVFVFVVSIIAFGCLGQSGQQNPSTAPGGSQASQSPASGGDGAQTHQVVILNFAFSPQSITIKAGDTVTWTNEDDAQHLIASDPHPAHTDLPGLQSNALNKGDSYSFTFTKVGTWGYHCHLHPSMTGTVVVQG